MNTTKFFDKQQSVKLSGIVDEVCIPFEELVAVNKEINPILNSLKQSEFFRIFRVNLESECPFWRSQGSCISNKCAVGECASDEVPDEWRQCEHTFNVERDLHKNEVTMIDSYPRSTKASEWMRIEEQDEGAVFVNLNKNSESMTFFNGSHIWDAIYKEN